MTEATTDNLQSTLAAKLAAFAPLKTDANGTGGATASFRETALDFFRALGYHSERTLETDGSPAAFRDTFDTRENFLAHSSALFADWRSVHLLFQITDAELSGEHPLFKETTADSGLFRSYVFFAIELTGTDYSRGKLAAVARALNRLFPMPVLLLIKHRTENQPRLSIAVINRRQNKLDATRDVLGKVSIIRDINPANPHRGHLDILHSLATKNLTHPQRLPITNFDTLHAAWEKLFDIQLLNKSFYKQLARWYKWATETIKLPILADHFKNQKERGAEQNTAQFVVRLLCRTLFCWFLKERRLIDPRLLEITSSAFSNSFPADFRTPKGNHYYRGILQNIFFNCLNTPLEARRLSASRAANDKTVADSALRKLNYRGKNYLPADFDYSLFDAIPYLNGGLFDCLAEDNASDTIEDVVISIPNALFFGGVDNTGTHQDGLNAILSAYKFTIEENSPFDQEIALDPELLGLVFENLLAEVDSNDPDAQKSARKASGSYYTPRRIIAYMVNEAIRLHLENTLRAKNIPASEFALLKPLLLHNRWPENDTADADTAKKLAPRIVAALDRLRILDPACGSGAFPMGALHRIVEILAIVDPRNALWKRQQLDIATQIPSAPIRAAALADIERAFARDNDNYGRKLYLIKNALYGVDIQPLAVLITKLRFFISLLAEQTPDLAAAAHNYALIPFPNLEAKILCANTLREVAHDLFAAEAVKSFQTARDAYYQPDISRDERDHRADEIAEQLSEILPDFAKEVTGETYPDRALQKQRNTALLREWFRHSTLPAPFFLFDVFFPEVCPQNASADSGFDIVIGNPPYGGTRISDDIRDTLALGSKDIYGAFIARFLGDGQKCTPLRAGGVLAYIVSDTFMTIKTHFPLRRQLMGNRLHKAIRVSGDTFKATVNTAIVVLQKGDGPGTTPPAAARLADAWENGPFCQMVDLTNISIHEQYDRFHALLQSTAGDNAPRQISTEDCASYCYPQALIATNTNLPFFVASPKLFALMNDTTAPTAQRELNGKTITVRTIAINGKQIDVTKLSEIAEVVGGVKTYDNATYIRAKKATGKYSEISFAQILTGDIADDEKINGIDTKKRDGRIFLPFDKSGDMIDDDGGIINYYTPLLFYIDWSKKAVRYYEDHNGLRNRHRYFQDGITYAVTGVYAPVFRLGCGYIFGQKGATIFPYGSEFKIESLLSVLCSKMSRTLTKSYLSHGVDATDSVIEQMIIPLSLDKRLCEKVEKIIEKLKKTPRYDYASHEQLEIDRLIYDAYGLNADDIEEVEAWYCRRYPKLAAAQRENLKRAGKLPSFTEWNIYCDESRHLAHDHQAVMFLGALRVPRERVRPLTEKLRDTLRELGFPHGKNGLAELKWTKISPAGLKFYEAALDFFASESDLAFHIIGARKTPPPVPKLPKPPPAPADGDYDTPEWHDYNEMLEATAGDAVDYLRAHEAWYYDRYFDLLRRAIKPALGKHIIYLDVKDTRGGPRIRALEERLSDAHYDWLRKDGRRVVEDIRQIASREVLLDQLTDVLLGAFSWLHTPPSATAASPAKRTLAEKLHALMETAPEKFEVMDFLAPLTPEQKETAQ